MNFLIAALLFSAIPSHLAAETVFGGEKHYTLGFDAGVRLDVGVLSYTADDPSGLPDSACKKNGNKARCQTGMLPSNLSGFAFSISRPAVPQYWAFADYGFSVGFRAYEATDAKTFGKHHDVDLSLLESPLDKASVHMYGPRFRGYFSLGLTPDYFPDLIAHLGLGGQTLFGQVRINGEEFRQSFVSFFGNLELEAVWLRLGNGSIGSFMSWEIPVGQQRLNISTIDGYSDFNLDVYAITVGVARLMVPLE
jgi:hypothetical protein